MSCRHCGRAVGHHTKCTRPRPGEPAPPEEAPAVPERRTEQELRSPPVPADLIPVTLAAQQLCIHISTLYRWIETGPIPAWKRVGQLFVSQAELNDLFKPVAVAPHPETWTERRKRERATEGTLARFKMA